VSHPPEPPPNDIQHRGLSPAEARLVANHAAASAIFQATRTGSPLLDLFNEEQRQQVVALMEQLARVLSATYFTAEEPSRGKD